MESDKLEKLFDSLGMDVPEEEVSAVTDLLDVEGTGEVGLLPCWAWYQKTGKRYVKEKGADEGDMKVEDVDKED